MKPDFFKIIMMLLLSALIVFDLVNSCKEKPNIEILDRAYEQNKQDIENINRDIRNILKSVSNANKYVDSLNQSREKTIERFNYEISKMDEIFRNNPDTLLVNAYLRCWTERLYKLPGFFQSSSDNIGASVNSKDSSSGRELLSSE